MEKTFCFVCGRHLMMRYPCGDPENGPAAMRCKDDAHPNVQDCIEQAIGDLSSDELRQIADDVEQVERQYETDE